MIQVTCWCCGNEMQLSGYVQRADGRFWCRQCHYDWVGEHFAAGLPLYRNSICLSQNNFAAKLEQKRFIDEENAKRSTGLHQGDPETAGVQDSEGV